MTDPLRGAVIAYLGLGANLGDREANLCGAVELLAATPGLRVRRVSSVYETEPVGPREQPWFLNQVVEVETGLSPRALLARALEIEAALGRARRERWGPRTIDIDILLYDDLVLEAPELTLPHPRLTHRAFSLVPLAELVPTRTLPGGQTVADVAARASTAGAEVRRR